MSADPPGAVSMMTEVRTKIVRRVRAAGHGLCATAIAVGRVRIQLWRAQLYRWRLRHVVFIGVTGSTGKTTTKDLIAAVGSTRFKGAKTEWSRNTLRWVVRTVLAVRPDDRFCVVEMSATRADDDLDLPVGVVRARMRGSAGGHRGVLSVIEAFQSSAIRRVKIGVGRPAQTAQVRDHVLTAFSPAERRLIDTACGVAADRVVALIAERTQQRRPAPAGDPA